MKKNFNTGLGKSVEADRVKLSRRRRQILRELGLCEELDSTELAERLLVQAKINRALVKTLEEKDRELARMDLILSVRDSEIKVKEARIAEFASHVAELGSGRKPVIKIARTVASALRESIGIRHTQSQRKPSGRKSGGQKGHSGAPCSNPKM